MTPQETFIVAFATIAISIVLLICLVLTIVRRLSEMTQRQKTAFFVFLGLVLSAAFAFGITVDIHNGVAG
jgi:1-acyl-sn-glycerol-3-phosphate acyltransferase